MLVGWVGFSATTLHLYTEIKILNVMFHQILNFYHSLSIPHTTNRYLNQTDLAHNV